MATHNRKEITDNNLRSLAGNHVILVVSQLDEKEYYRAKFPNVTVVKCMNEPLGRKWNAGVEKAREMGANPLIIVGSDDFLSNKLRNGHSFIGLTKWFSFDEVGKSMYHTEYINFNKEFPIGSGRAYSKELLDKCDWQIFDIKAKRLLDDLGYKQARDFGKIALLDTPEILAVKGKWICMNPIKAYLTSKNIKAEKSDLSHLEKFDYKT